VDEAQKSRSPTQALADKAAGWLFYIALASAIATAVAWLILDGPSVEVVARVATVLVIACPHALGLAIPLVVSLTTSMGAKNGILIRNRLAMETMRRVDTVMFDKTGTLTHGTFSVVEVATVGGLGEDDVLGIGAGLEADSEHPIAKGIRQSAEERGVSLADVSDFEAIKGKGVRGTVDGEAVYVGGPALLESLDLTPDGPLEDLGRRCGDEGATIVYVVQGETLIGAIAVADTVRSESRGAIEDLHELGIDVAMLTGDSEAVASSVADELGIDDYFAEVLPEHKDQKVVDLQEDGRRVVMVGDGVNDAPALTRADVGVAIGGGTDVAIESADIVLVKDDPADVVRAIELARASYRKMRQNLWWAAGYNIVAIPLAAGVLAPVGIVLSPAVGAALMSVSTIVVALNAQTLRRF
jgi:Cu2+-exporting ATPase